MAQSSRSGKGEALLMQERALFAAKLEKLTPEECRHCPALSFMAMRLTTRVVSRGELEVGDALTQFEDATRLCPKLTNAALRGTTVPDCDVYS